MPSEFQIIALIRNTIYQSLHIISQVEVFGQNKKGVNIHPS